MKRTVKNGSVVSLHYKGTFPDGQIFDDSRSRGDTLMVVVGSGRVLPDFDNALVGMSEGQTKKISLTPERAYGPVDTDAIVVTPKSAFPEDFPFVEGMPVSGQTSDGQVVRAKIVAVDEESVTVDHNHPLAGKDINFEIELVKIEEGATSE